MGKLEDNKYRPPIPIYPLPHIAFKTQGKGSNTPVGPVMATQLSQEQIKLNRIFNNMTKENNAGHSINI